MATVTTKFTFGSILETVTKTASTITSVLDTTTKSIGMVDRFVGKASDEQQLSYRKDRRTFVHNLVRTASEEQAQADIKVIEFCNQSDQHKELFEKSYIEFSDLFEDELNIASPKTSATS